MGHRFAELAFTDTVKSVQEKLGSRAGYARREGGDVDYSNELGPNEAGFISERDSFYLATVSESGWPYIQHRGGPAGFLRVLDARTIGFADFAGNKQYVSVGNLMTNDRVSLFLMDYANRTRLKLLGRARLVGRDEPDVLAELELPAYRARVERGMIFTIEAFDWNCPQHITQRYSLGDVERATASLRHRIAELETELATLRAPGE